MTGKLANLAQVAGKIDFIEGDICDYQAIRQAVTDVDIVFHEAAIPSVPRSINEPNLNHDVNINGTFNLLLAAHEAGTRRVIYAASSSAYGEIGSGAKQEEQLPDPLSPYAVAKLVGEYYCRVFTSVYQLETVALRYFNVFGPRQDPTSPYSGVISKFMTAVLNGESPVIYGDGEQSRDFTYVANIVDANLRAIEAPDAPGKMINVGVGAQITLNQLLAQIQKIAGTDLKPIYEPPRAGDIRHSLADIRRAENLLGYLPTVDLAGGLRYTIDWYSENK
jgi:nucleoside-diphosphate-sugar epimerase